MAQPATNIVHLAQYRETRERKSMRPRANGAVMMCCWVFVPMVVPGAYVARWA